MRRFVFAGAALWMALTAASVAAQEPSPAKDAEPQTETSAPAGKVIVSDDHLPVGVDTAAGQAEPGPADHLPAAAVTDAERSAPAIREWKLAVHLRPEASRAEVQAGLLVQNISAVPVTRLPLQISSTLRWQSVASESRPMVFTQSPVATDEDHTGYAQEAVITLPQPLAPGASVRLSVLYTGVVSASGARLELLGIAADHAAVTEWDAIVPTSDKRSTALRGFGHVLWYPVAAPLAALGAGNQVTALEARQRQLGLDAAIDLQLTVEYAGDPPDGVIFNGRLQPLRKLPDDADQVVGESHGVATADFALQPLGFRIPSLFLTAQQPLADDTHMLDLLTPRAAASEPYRAAVALVAPMLEEWFGAAPATPLLLLDHAGEPYEDAAFMTAPLLPDAEPEALAPGLVPALTHAWFDSEKPEAAAKANVWLHQAMPEFMAIQYTQRTTPRGEGRATVLTQLARAAVLIGLAEPDFSAQPTPSGEPLVSAGSAVMLRAKGASVLWQLQEIVGVRVFQQALQTLRHNLLLNPASARDEHAFQTTLEHAYGQDLGWFFADWVYRDRGLPDLTIVQANPRALPAKGGRSAGYLVAVEVRNDGDAVADVPVTVRGEGLKATERLRIPAHATASTRVVFESTPEDVEVNDGSVPELRTTSHQLHIAMEPAAL